MQLPLTKKHKHLWQQYIFRAEHNINNINFIDLGEIFITVLVESYLF